MGQGKIRPLFADEQSLPIAVRDASGQVVRVKEAEVNLPQLSVRPLFAPVVESTTISAGPAVVSLPGMFVPRHLTVTLEELRQLPTAAEDAQSYQEAARYLNAVNIDDEKNERTTLGVLEQEAFAVLAGRLLVLSQNESLDLMRRQVSELKAIFRVEEKPWWEKVFDVGDSVLESIKKQQKKVKECQDDLTQVIPEIQRLMAQCKSDGVAMGQVLIGIDAAALSAEFLRRYTEAHRTEKTYFAEWALMLERRGNSLLTTRVTILQARTSLGLVLSNLRHFDEIRASVLLTLLPAWCAACSATISSWRVKDTARCEPMVALSRKIVAILDQEGN